MADHTYRVMVRGRFADLDETGRARLLAVAGEHDVLRGGFSDEGALSYDAKLDFFSFRVQVRAAEDAGDRAVSERGMALAGRAVDALGVDFRDMKATVTDVDLIKVKRKR
ncbi:MULTISPECIES: DUF6204 family protein [Actinosynnema]|uniref:DUF6204 family protein n=1 Tax=Actinosynnema TaxID=40566 RepID=UPI0020A2C80B|nr:DUF6204 family protein [Actinosynnema pretiosum]MCP2092637.1 hypothetical protein [Actinosynnema pretiosum]